MDKLSAIVDVLMATECLKVCPHTTSSPVRILSRLTFFFFLVQPLVPTVTDFPLHLQPYAREIIETKLKEAKVWDQFLFF